MRSCVVCVAILTLTAGRALGQDSVASTPGGNDAMSPYEAGTIRTRYAVDSSPLTSSWGNGFRIAPLLKATRDLDPMFRTQILGSSAVSTRFATTPALPAPSYAHWTTPGPGINPGANASSGVLSPSAFTDQFAVSFVDHALDPTNLVVALVSRQSGNSHRFFVERTHAASSRQSAAGVDTSTLSLGSVSTTGRAYLRADSFTALDTTANRIAGDNILRIDAPAISATAVNTLSQVGGVNSATDSTNSVYIVRNDSAPYSTPAVSDATGFIERALIFDLRAFYRSGTSVSSLSATTSAHRPTGIAGHRGNPTFAPISPLGGSLGTVAALAKPTAGGATAPVNTIAAFGVNSSGQTAPVAAGTPRAFVLPSPITAPGFSANAAGEAVFDQYKSQHAFRGANGPVGIGRNGAGQLVLAAVASDPVQGEFIAVVTATGPASQTWSVAARPGQSVLDGPNGATIGTLAGTDDLLISAPAIDLLGNVYFAATWTPTLEPTRIGVFKAVNTDGAGTYRIERILSEGDSFTGSNSATPYQITSIALRDSDSLASGAFHHASLLQAQTPGSTTTDPASPLAAGGLIVNATITYDRSGTPEPYEVVLLITPDLESVTLPCPGNFVNTAPPGQPEPIDLADLLGFLDQWLPNLGQLCPDPGNCPGNYVSTAPIGQPEPVDLADLLGFLSDWSPNLGSFCP
ncbi:MAG: hypothetical protein KF768_08620 [Phycisphaeraceae bacterium]|nr:hypothetical protein [Phycisphaeraceae bacterium]